MARPGATIHPFLETRTTMTLPLALYSKFDWDPAKVDPATGTHYAGKLMFILNDAANRRGRNQQGQGAMGLPNPTHRQLHLERTGAQIVLLAPRIVFAEDGPPVDRKNSSMLGRLQTPVTCWPPLRRGRWKTRDASAERATKKCWSQLRVFPSSCSARTGARSAPTRHTMPADPTRHP